ncbi:MAG: hypothetical protein V4608_05840 [Bacteroidota bacterium]
MKSIQKIAALTLMVLFLVSSLGLTINKMVCLKNGKVKVSLTHAKDCCPEKSSSAYSIEAPCCVVNNTSFHLTDFNPSPENKIPVISDCALPYYHAKSEAFIYTKETTNLFFADLPPPPHGKQLLSFISILII